MIVRILGEGQFELGEAAMARVEALDAVLSQAVADEDEPRFAKALAAILNEVRTAGSKVEEAALVPSDLALPGEDTTLDEVRQLLEREAPEDA